MADRRWLRRSRAVRWFLTFDLASTDGNGFQRQPIAVNRRTAVDVTIAGATPRGEDRCYIDLLVGDMLRDEGSYRSGVPNPVNLGSEYRLVRIEHRLPGWDLLWLARRIEQTPRVKEAREGREREDVCE